MKKVRLKEIARLAGCSVAVASTVLNQSRSTIGVSVPMQATIRRLALELGYRPNFAAQSLVRRQSRTLGVFVANSPASGLGYPYEGKLLHGIEQACQQHGYDLLLINIGGQADPSVCLDRLVQSRADGLVLIRCDGPTPWVAELARRTDRLVAVDCVDPEPTIDAVSFDNDQAVALALEHLLSMGHRRIAFFGSCLAVINRTTSKRQQAFEHHMKCLGLSLDPRWIHDRRWTPVQESSRSLFCRDEGEAGVEHLLKIPRSERPTAILAYNDLVAFAALRRLNQHGVAVPGQISLIGIDHSDVCHYCQPTLTSVEHPLSSMGQLAATWLIERAGESKELKSDRTPRRQTIAASLAIHGSTCRTGDQEPMGYLDNR